MKITIAMLSLVISANVFAYSSVDSTALTSIAPTLSSEITSGTPQKAQATIILNDAQEMIQSGKASAFLSQKIKETQEINAGASESDALELLINQAEAILK